MMAAAMASRSRRTASCRRPSASRRASASCEDRRSSTSATGVPVRLPSAAANAPRGQADRRVRAVRRQRQADHQLRRPPLGEQGVDIGPAGGLRIGQRGQRRGRAGQRLAGGHADALVAVVEAEHEAAHACPARPDSRARSTPIDAAAARQRWSAGQLEQQIGARRGRSARRCRPVPVRAVRRPSRHSPDRPGNRPARRRGRCSPAGPWSRSGRSGPSPAGWSPSARAGGAGSGRRFAAPGRRRTPAGRRWRRVAGFRPTCSSRSPSVTSSGRFTITPSAPCSPCSHR